MNHHPEYYKLRLYWQKYRLVLEGGRPFVNEYLKHFSSRESIVEYNARKEITPNPGIAKAELIKIRNAIYQRLIDVDRFGDERYIESCKKGISKKKANMNYYIGREILTELLAMGKVGVLVDRPQMVPYATKADETIPYFTTYRAEDIINWKYDSNGNLIKLVLINWEDSLDKDGLPTNKMDYELVYELTPEGVIIKYKEEEYVLKMSKIPFHIFELSDSLLTEASDYQIAILNMVSSDINYTTKANFPIYTEQIDSRNALKSLQRRPGVQDDDAPTSKNTEEIVEVGPTKGRQYGKDLERPGYIYPSSEPLMASITLRNTLKEEIKDIMHTTLTTVTPSRATTSIKELDEKGIEAGLSSIALELQFGEEKLAEFFHIFLDSSVQSSVKYPELYDLRSDSERRKEAEDILDLTDQFASTSAHKEIQKQALRILFKSKIPDDVLKVMYKEIDSKEMIVDPETLIEDLNAGLVSQQFASEKIRGYPAGESEKSKKDHEERAARIVKAQTKAKMQGLESRDSNLGDNPDPNTGVTE